MEHEKTRMSHDAGVNISWNEKKNIILMLRLVEAFMSNPGISISEAQKNIQAHYEQ